MHNMQHIAPSAGDLVSESDIRRYEEDGVVCLRGLFDSSWIERLRAATQRSLEAGGIEMTRTGDQGRFHSNLFMWRTDADFRAFVFESPAVAIARSIMRAHSVRFYFDHLFVKEPGTQTPTPWHHDQPYWPVRGEHVCSIWLTLDPVTYSTSGLEYVKGSHRWGQRFKPENFGASRRAETLSDADNAIMPDIDGNRDQYTFLSWDMEPGDCLVHHSLAVHGSPGNSSSAIRRRALSTRWLGDDAVYWPQSDAAEGGLHDPRMTKGQRVDSDMFPIVTPTQG
jgi:ectoine hydroxylase-related dioxygenase (phytanoyl-CoA dioxygenase family)